MNLMQPTSGYSLVGSVLVDTDAPQLIECDDPMLAIGDPCDLPIPSHPLRPPTGLKAAYISTFRPVGGGLGACGYGHR